jgi:hypothetical protein
MRIGELAIDVERRRRGIEAARRQVLDGMLGFHSVRDQERELDTAVGELRAAIPDEG